MLLDNARCFTTASLKSAIKNLRTRKKPLDHYVLTCIDDEEMMVGTMKQAIINMVQNDEGE